MKHRFEVLDIFRGIFASMVVFFHMSFFTSSPILKNNLVLNSDLCVDFFFVLSGFVITYSYQKISASSQLGSFLKKRFFRLYPLHLIMLFVFVGMEFTKQSLSSYIQVNQLNNANNNVLTFFSNLFLLHSVKLPGVTDVSWNIPSWSISAEVLCYILFGIVALGINKVGVYKARNLVFGGIALTALLIFYSIRGDFNLARTFDYGFLRAWVGFFTGAVCFNVFSNTRDKMLPVAGGVFTFFEVILVLAMIVMAYYGDYLKPWGIIYEALFFCSIYIFAFEKGFLSKLLKKSVILQKIGTYSYSIYMTHAFLLSIFNIIFFRIIKMPPGAYSYMFVVNYALIYFVSQWSYKNIELRFQLKKKKTAAGVYSPGI
ncbi:MAG TPA: acyltransferase [Chitinophagaceae bacterium]|nr:acyltransferase [Chitinophagaceae bacterium]